MSRPKISDLAMELYKRAIAEEKNEDIYAAGLRERQTFLAFVDVLNYYNDFYKEPNYFFRILVQAMHQRKDEELHKEIMKVWKEN